VRAAVLRVQHGVLRCKVKTSSLNSHRYDGKILRAYQQRKQKDDGGPNDRFKRLIFHMRCSIQKVCWTTENSFIPSARHCFAAIMSQSDCSIEFLRRPIQPPLHESRCNIYMRVWGCSLVPMRSPKLHNVIHCFRSFQHFQLLRRFFFIAINWGC
jgi:hypothetical protein